MPENNLESLSFFCIVCNTVNIVYDLAMARACELLCMERLVFQVLPKPADVSVY